jgi:predicted nucleotidyltransferase
VSDDKVVLLSGVVGSTAYGLNHEGSDIDRLGIFTWPTEAFFRLEQPDDYWEHKTPTVDIAFHEARKFISLALGGNPTVSELLWLKEYEHATPWGMELVEMRSAFLSAPRVKDAYLGYARQQFYKLRETGAFSSALRNRSEKHARHLRRLVEQGFQLYSTGELTLRLENPGEVMEFGRQVAEDPSRAEEFMSRAIRRFEDTRSPLPAMPDTRSAEDWLLRLRKDFYR